MNTNTKTVKDRLEGATKNAARTVSHAAEVTTESLRDIAADASSRASSAAALLRDSATDRLDDAVDALSESGDRFAETLRRAAEEPEAGSVQSRVMSAVAGGVTSAANAMHGRGVSDIASDIRALARRNPGAFAVGAALAGFAFARFLQTPGKNDHQA